MYLFVSKEKEEIRQELLSLLPKESSSLTTFHADTFVLSDFFQEVETPSLFFPKKHIVIQGVDKLIPSAVERLCQYLKNPVESCTLYLTASELLATSPLYKLVEKKGKICRLRETKPWEEERQLALQVIEGGKKEGVEIPFSVATLLVQSVERHLLFTELEKILCFLSPEKKMQEEHIVAVAYRGTPQETLWQLGDALLQKEGAKAIKIGAHLLSKGISPFLLLAHLRSQFMTGIEILRAAFTGKVAENFPYLKGKILEKKVEILKGYGENRLRSSVQRIFAKEEEAKTSSMQPLLLLEILFMQLTHL